MTLGLVLLGPTSPAMAYRQTKTCLTQPERDPRAPTNIPTCSPGEVGAPVSWPRRQVRYQISSPGAQQQPDPQAALQAVRAAMREWSAQRCSDFEFVYDGEAAATQRASDDGVNLIAWVEEGWAQSSAVIALTTTVMTHGGVLIDADLELNAVAYRFSAQPEGVAPGSVDLSNTVAHEAGHMLGLDEVSEPEATMHYKAAPDETLKRTLHPDDIAGLCTIYPAGLRGLHDAPSTDSPTDADPEDRDGGCCAVVSHGSPGDEGSGRALLLGVLCVGVMARMRRPPQLKR